MLKPRSVREVIQAGWFLYRRRFRFVLTASLSILFPYAMIAAYVQAHFTMLSSDEMQQLMTDVGSNAQTSSLLSVLPHGSEIWFIVLGLMYMLLVVPLLQGILVHMTAQIMLKKQDVTVSEAGNLAFRRLLPNVGTLVLVGLIYVFFIAVFTLIIFLIFSLLGSVSQALASVIVVLGSIALFIGVIWFLLRVSMVSLVVVEEHRSFFGAIRQSFRLTRDQAKRLFGFFVMLFLICLVIETFLSLMGSVFFPSAGGGLMIDSLISIFLTPFAMLCMSVMYVDLRIRRGE
ncbi:hypothetical protein [Alicyclobacillus fodiniaquatilis]|jgi:hypothetical protein|uniref:Glycerophosphoryl diester phosphodiesterase membrane domain-containing protein n=1 Tax=Alicyclobacillus fodiniaquatilis TaxID=1661150 RepID=A0ABW4JE54_9BACL